MCAWCKECIFLYYLVCDHVTFASTF